MIPQGHGGDPMADEPCDQHLQSIAQSLKQHLTGNYGRRPASMRPRPANGQSPENATA